MVPLAGFPLEDRFTAFIFTDKSRFAVVLFFSGKTIPLIALAFRTGITDRLFITISRILCITSFALFPARFCFGFLLIVDCDSEIRFESFYYLLSDSASVEQFDRIETFLILFIEGDEGILSRSCIS